MIEIRNFVGGEFVPPGDGALLDCVEPATGQDYARVPDSGDSDVETAVEAAKGAFPEWSSKPASERSAALLRIADLIERHADELARIESVDTGKPIELAGRVDIPRAAANFRFFATAVLHTHSELHETDRQALNYTQRRPHGVAGLISPWNLPLYLLSWKIAPALATGNTVVAKPSEVTPMSAHRLAELCTEAGLPPGVLNIVHGRGPKAGAALVDHPDVPVLSFTGSTRAGREIALSAASRFKKLTLEMGGKNPNIVFADSDPEAAVATSVRAAFANQGQICLCGSRILVERTLFAEFVERFVKETLRIRVGDPLEAETEHGALVSAEHLGKVTRYVELAREEGGRIECGGGVPENLPARCQGGYFFSPTVITGLGPECRVNQEEIFGPVVTLLPFDDEAEAVRMANSTEYGLAASIWTTDLGRAHRVAEAVRAGTVWVNCWMLRDLRVPFGGQKSSGLGKEGGEEALRFFTEPKNVCVRLEPGT